MVHFVITVTAVDDVQAGPNFTVNSTAWTTDGACTEGNCTVREAITAANGDGVASTIDLAAGAVYTVSGVDVDPNGLQITTPITINAHGAIITRSTAVAAARFFYVAKGGSLTLNEIQLQNGLLTGDVGGAILNDGTLAVLNSMLQYNAATKGGAVYNAGTASLYNNTLYLNTSGEGAVYTSGPFSMYSSTLFNNTLSGGAPATNPTALVLATCGSSSCILFNNLLLSSSSASPLCNFMVTSLSGAGNLATDSSCKFVGVTTYSALNASTPASNGGPTLTMAIGASSTAIDKGYTDPSSTNGCKNPNIKNRDQRGYNRVADGNADNVAVCDVGAYEYNSTPLPPTSEPPDTTPPEVRILLTPALPDGANGWYRSAVTVDPQASDESGIQQLRCMLDPATPPTTFDDLPDAPCPRPGGGIVAADGAHTVFAAAKDVWNNTSVPVSVSFKIDASAPFITCPMGGPFVLGTGDHAIGPAGVDASVSGLNEAASTLSGNVPAANVGPKTLIFKAVDLAGNEAIEACAYLVMYEYGGFYAPVKNPPDLNKATAGQSVPLKFSLAGDQGLSVVADGYPLSQQVDCATLAALGDPLAAEPAGKSRLTYDPGNGWYSYVWKTSRAWAGTCRVLTLQLDDATQHLAYFQFK
jgi:CSLREA domain-containing protein